MKKHYGYDEDIVKDTKQRQDYADGVAAFLENGRTAAERERAKFVTPEKMCADREKYRREYIKMLGYPLVGCAPCGKITAEKTLVKKLKGVGMYRMILHIGEIPFYGIYFEQEQISDNTPFLLCFHGGGGTPELVSGLHKDSANYNHICARAAFRGANVFCPQLLLWDESVYGNKYDRTDTDAKLRQLGGSVTALELYLILSSLDYFIHNERINADRIGALGLSYGGMYALATAAADTRIKSCFAMSQFNDRFNISWADWSYKNARNTFTDAETAALVAPRALCIAVGDNDEIFPSEGACRAAEETAKYFAACDAEEKFDFYVFCGKHESDLGERGFDFLFSNL